MPLIDLKTDLKSLKYGADRPGGGNSGQPYMKVDINTVDRGLNRIRFSNLDEGAVRGGFVGALNASIVDTLRIGKWLTDLPKGPLWIVKQIGLQLSNPRLEIRKTTPEIGGVLGAIGGAINEIRDKISIGPTRIYNAGLNTIAQVPVNAFGVHFNRHGIFPVQDDNTKYLAIAKDNNKNTKFTKAGLPKSSSNRLIQKAIKLLPPPTKTGRLLNILQSGLSSIGISLPFSPSQQIVDEYIAGPGSVYGVGKTTIRRYDYTSNGINKQDPQEKGKVNYIGTLGVSNQYFALIATSNNPTSILGSIIGSSATSGIFAGRSVNLTRYNNLSTSNPTNAPDYIDTATYSNIDTKSISLVVSPTNNDILTGNVGIAVKAPVPVRNASYQTYQRIINSRKLKETTYTVDGVQVNAFGIYGNNGEGIIGGPTSKEILPDAITKPVYSNGNKVIKIDIPWNEITREKRVGSGQQDQINLTPIFSNNAGTLGNDIVIPGVGVKNINDLVKFRIQAIDGSDPTQANWMLFRAYLTQFTDNVDATWGDVKYVGRGESFYIYNGFTRKINIGFKVAALSSQEMKPMYQKLNYLMGNVMPDYSGEGLMRGPLIKMTVGNWIDGQDGILNSLNYTIPQDSPWEIGLKVNGVEPLILPHVVEVNMTFTPIGSQTKGINKISSKSYDTSHIAQNYNQNDPQYIEGKIQKYNIPPRISVPSNYTRSDEDINFGFLAENAG